MDTQYIEVKLIDVPKASAESRSFSKDFAVKLADSIGTEGMYNAIVVRPNKAVPGRYILVQGRHRLYATSKILKLDVIEARNFEEMDDTDAEMATIAENLFRNPLSNSQHIISLRKWFEHYQAKNPGRVGSGHAGGAASAAKRAKAKIEAIEGQVAAETAEGQPAEAESAPEPAASTVGFDEMVAASTGKSRSATMRDTRVAKAFTTDQLEALEQMQVNRADKIRLAKIKDATKRGEVVNLIVSGMSVEDALKNALGDDIPTPGDSKSKEAREAISVAKEEVEADLSDDEWFDKFCKEKAVLLKDATKFKSDALLFRKVTDQRHLFRTKVKKHVAETKKAGATGPFYNILNRVISMSHPKDWMLCDCKGTGESPTDPAKPCGRCFGCGYAMRTETYN